MLAALIFQNNPSRVLPGVLKIDRGGGGPTLPSFTIADYYAAMEHFPLIAGEHPVQQAVRKHRYLTEALPQFRRWRENREAMTFLAGVEIGARAQAELEEEARLAAAKVVPARALVAASNPVASLVGAVLVAGTLAFVAGTFLGRRRRR
jgi:hypothetical protein